MKISYQRILLAATVVMLVVVAGCLVYFQARVPEIKFADFEEEWLDENLHSIRYAPLPDAPPFDFFDKDGKHRGITADYVHLIEASLKTTFIPVRCNTMQEVKDAWKAGEIDLVGSLQNREERHEFLRFTDPYYSVGNVILMRKGAEHPASTMEELKASTIAIVEGSATYEYVSEEYPLHERVAVSNVLHGFELLSGRQVDAMITDKGTAFFYIEQKGFTDIEKTGSMEYTWDLCFASTKEHPELNLILDKVLKSITPFQRMKINNRWMASAEKEKYLTRIAIGCLLFTLLVSSVISIRNRILKKQVRHRTHELGRIRHSHRKTTLALDESEERFRAMVESSDDMIWEMDRFGNYTYVSPRVRDILGYEAQEVIGQSSHTFMTPADSAKTLSTLRKATPTSVHGREIKTYLHRNGRPVVLETSGIAFADNEGQLAGFRGVSRDITGRIEAEKALKESEERFRNLVETTSDWIWEVDTKGIYTYTSPQAGNLLGYAPSELIGTSLYKTMPTKEASALKTLFEDIVEQGAPIHSLVNINLHKEGRTVVLETSAVPFYDKDWKIQGYRGISRDITERMATEKQLDFERNLFRSFMENAPDLIYFKDADGHYIEVNAAKAAEVRLPPEEVVGKTDFDFLSPDQAQRRFEEELEVIRTQKAMRTEELITTADGDQWYLTTKVPRYDEQGKVVGTFGTSWDITYRKQAAEELRLLRAQLSNVIDSMPSILVGVGADGCVTQWNREAENITRITAAGASGKPLKEVFPRLAKEMVKVERAIRERAAQKEERIPINEDGRVRYNDITVYPLLENNAEGAVIRVDDVTDRVLIEDSIRNMVEGVSAVGRQFFRSMANQLAKTLDADFTYISELGETPGTMRTIAVSDEGQAGKNFDYAMSDTPCAMVMEKKTSINVSNVREHYANNELFSALEAENYVGIPLLDSDGQPQGCMVALYKTPIENLEFATSIMQVFAGRTAAELERLQATKELLSLRNLLSNIINSMPSILVGVDAGGRVMQWNREAERVTGITAKQAQGQSFDSVFPSMWDEMDRIVEAIGKRQLHHDERIPCTIKNEPRYANVTVYPLSTDGAEGAVVRVDDVTDRVRIEEMMVQTEKMMSVGGLAAGMAHEINNPLAGILQNLQVMRNRVTHHTERNVEAASHAGTSLEAIQTYMHDRGIIKMIDTITEAGRRAAKIVDNMLSFSRKDEAHYEPNDLRNIMESSLDLASNDYNLKKRFDFRHIQINREYDETLELIPCEGNQIQQVVLNLLSNSAQAMAEQENRSQPPQITLRLKREHDMALIEVEDNGPGMDAETRKRVFEPFFTTKEVGHGTGMGLSVSYFIITENHAGTMRVRSAPGKGACFSIRIPFEHKKAMWGLRL